MGPQQSLNEYLKEAADIPFEWGVHDCLTFTNEAWRRMYGYGWADDWLGRYMIEQPYGIRPMRREQLQSEFGYFSFAEAVDERLKRIKHVPPRGALVATKKAERWAIGHALGICNGIKCAFLSHNGVLYLPVDDVDKAWVPR